MATRCWQPIRVRIQLLGMIIHADETLEPIVAGLTPNTVGDILAAISIECRLGCLSFDGDALQKQSGPRPSQRMPNDIVPTIIFNQRSFS